MAGIVDGLWNINTSTVLLIRPALYAKENLKSHKLGKVIKYGKLSYATDRPDGTKGSYKISYILIEIEGTFRSYRVQPQCDIVFTINDSSVSELVKMLETSPSGL